MEYLEPGSNFYTKVYDNNRDSLAKESIIVSPRFPNFPKSNSQNLKTSWQKFREDSLLFLDYIKVKKPSKSKNILLVMRLFERLLE